MERVLEVQIAEHYIIVNHRVQPCEGMGRWSSKETSRELITGPGVMFANWSAECPKCRKVVSGFDSRIRLPIREALLPVTEKVVRIMKTVESVMGRKQNE